MTPLPNRLAQYVVRNGSYIYAYFNGTILSGCAPGATSVPCPRALICYYNCSWLDPAVTSLGMCACNPLLYDKPDICPEAYDRRTFIYVWNALTMLGGVYVLGLFLYGAFSLASKGLLHRTRKASVLYITYYTSGLIFPICVILSCAEWYRIFAHMDDMFTYDNDGYSNRIMDVGYWYQRVLAAVVFFLIPFNLLNVALILIETARKVELVKTDTRFYAKFIAGYEIVTAWAVVLYLALRVNYIIYIVAIPISILVSGVYCYGYFRLARLIEALETSQPARPTSQTSDSHHERQRRLRVFLSNVRILSLSVFINAIVMIAFVLAYLIVPEAGVPVGSPELGLNLELLFLVIFSVYLYNVFIARYLHYNVVTSLLEAHAGGGTRGHSHREKPIEGKGKGVVVVTPRESHHDQLALPHDNFDKSRSDVVREGQLGGG